MSIKEGIMAEIEAMDEKHLEEIYAVIKQFSQAQKEKRIGGLNPSSITTTKDFDAPLPDEFWLDKSNKS